jgi:hypothetical protein
MDDINNIDENNENNENNENKTHNFKKIKANNDIEINGIVYFIPDKYLGNALFYLSNEHKHLYKYIIALYIDALIITNKIENISKITKIHMNDSIICAEKILSYIIMGKVYIYNLTNIEKIIIVKIPEYLIQKINPTIIEKIE